MADISYVTLTELRRQWEANNTNIADVSAPVMMSYARRATAVVDYMARMEFAPRIDTKYYDAYGSGIDQALNSLLLNAPIVELTSTTLADGTSLTTDTDVRLYPRGAEPAIELQIYYPNTSLWTNYTNDPHQSIAITGVWCWRDNYSSDGWQLSGDAVSTAQVTTSATTISVTDADGANWIGDTPRLDAGMMIKIDGEYMAVVDTDTASTPNTITVIRAIRGATAATHEIAAAISVFTPNEDIVRATQLIAFYNYARRGETTRATFDGVSVVVGMEVPAEVNLLLERYMWNRWY